MNPLTDIIPASARRYVYGLYVLAGVLLGALQTAGVSEVAGVAVSTLLAVYAYLGVPLGATAASNVSRPRGEHVREDG